MTTANPQAPPLAAGGGTPPPPPRPAARTATKLPRYEQLDAFRLIVITVVIFHTYQHSRGPSGFVLQLGTLSDSIVRNLDWLLSFYFIMTGFGVAVQLMRATIAGKSLPAPRDFVIKRLARLVPLYILVFLIVWEIRYAGTETQWNDLLWGITLMQSWSSEHIFRTIDPAWYLSVEIFFVFVLAAVGIPLMRRISKLRDEQARWRGCTAFAVALILIGLTWKGVAAWQGVDYDEWGIWFAPPAWVDIWGAGMLFGLAVMRWDRPDRWAPRGVPLLMVLAALAWLWFLTVISDQGWLPRFARWDSSTFALIGLMAAAVMTPPERRTRKIMGSAPIQLIAGISYGVFLWHAPIMNAFEPAFPLNTPEEWIVSTLALLAISFLVSFFTLRWVELPGQGFARIHLPERRRRWADARPIPTKVRPGDAVPAELAAILGDALPTPGVVLIGGAEKERPPGQDDGISVALRTLQAERFAMNVAGGDVAAVIAEDPERLRRRQAFDELDLPVRPADGARIAQSVGIGGLRQRWGPVVPARVALVIDGDGVVRDVLTDREGARLVRRAVDAAAPVARPGRGLGGGFDAGARPEPI
ncbi:MAG: acyltransferase [Solirubrobacteraceae bacterium]|nr:acyltransferase [Solirubrobacteraceae bacterium]